MVIKNISGFTTSDVFRPRSSPSLFTSTWTANPADTLVPLPDAPPFTYEPGRGFVVTGTTPGRIGSASPWTSQNQFGVSTLPTTRPGDTATQFITGNQNPNQFGVSTQPTTRPAEFISGSETGNQNQNQFGVSSQATTRPVDVTTRFLSGSDSGTFVGPPISASGTSKSVEETSRFFPTTQRIGTGGDVSNQQTESRNGFESNESRDKLNRTVDESGRDRAIDIGQVERDKVMS